MPDFALAVQKIKKEYREYPYKVMLFRDVLYVIFITENDVLKSNLPIYHIDRTIRETQKSFNDEAHIIYVNSQIINETELGKLMHDFRCKDAKDMYTYSALGQSSKRTFIFLIIFLHKICHFISLQMYY